MKYLSEYRDASVVNQYLEELVIILLIMLMNLIELLLILLKDEIITKI